MADVSVDTNDGELRFFEFSRKAGTLRPKRCGVLEFPRTHGPGSEENAAQAAAALKKFAERYGYQTVQCVIHEGDAYIFKQKVPTTDPSLLRAAIEASLEENVPMPPAEAIFEYDVLAIDKVRGESTVVVSAVSEKVVERYRALLESGTLAPVSFETESHAIARASIRKGDQATHAVLCIKGHHTVVFIAERGKVSFSSSIEVGSADIEAASAKDPGSFDALLPVFSTLQDELGKILTYHKAAAKKEGVEQDIADVILLGSCARIPGFSRYISLASKLPVRVGSVWANALSPESEVPDLDEKSSLDYAALIGMYLN